jgi:hypothetical protein
MRRHHNQVGTFLLSYSHNCPSRVAFADHAPNGKAVKLGPERLVFLFLRLSDDFREQVPASSPLSFGTPAAWLTSVTTCSIAISELKWRANVAA